MKKSSVYQTNHSSNHSKKTNTAVIAELNKSLRRMSITGYEKIGASMPKRIANLLFVGAVVAGSMFPMSVSAQAADTALQTQTVLSSSGSSAEYTLTATKNRGGKQTTANFSPPAADAQGVYPSLEDYVGKLFCTGCGKHCPLTAPQCGIGTSQYEQAVTLYETTVSSDSASDNTTETSPSSPPATGNVVLDESTTVSPTQPSTETESDERIAADSAQDGNTTAAFQEFISGLFCSGCGKHCPLTALQCGRGQTYLDEAKAEFEALSTQQTQDTSVQGSDTAGDETDTAAGLLDSVMEYAPFGGLMVGGVYYTIEVLKKKKEPDDSDNNKLR